MFPARKPAPMVSILFLLVASMAVAAPPRVQLELVTEAGFPIGGQQKWISLLQGVDVTNVRIRGATSGDQPQVTNVGTEQQPSYRVVGVLTARNTLLLPGARIRFGDRAAISAWVEKLRDVGAEDLTAATGVFGMTEKQLLEVHEALSKPVTFSTAGQPVRQVLSQITRGIALDVQTDASAERPVAEAGTVLDELSGLSSGTAMAAVLRPLGLVLVPARLTGNRLQLLVTDYRQAKESWPVGWPSEKAPAGLAPDLFKFLTVQIQDISLSDSLKAVKGRVEVPMLMDHNSLARQRIDPAKVIVNLPEERTFYKSILDRLLRQAELKSEIRVDENGLPFLWISTLKR